MWIMTNNSYLSIVSKDCGPAELLVRASACRGYREGIPKCQGNPANQQ
jgi:hypothetical protein